jgi:hypothetical protein
MGSVAARSASLTKVSGFDGLEAMLQNECINITDGL